MTGRVLSSLGVVVLLASAVPFARAQAVGASLRGTITDGTGATLPGATVTILNVGTGAAKELQTDSAGRYTAPILAPGDYEVHVTLTGFQPHARRGLRLAVGQDTTLDVRLELGTVSEQVTVTGAAPGVDLASGAVSGLVTDQQIRDLPLNGRSFQQLALLQVGVTAALTAGNDVVGGRTPKISINGARPEVNNFLLDGTDINNVYNKTPGSVAGVLLGVDAVLEFQVLTNAYSAEFGRSAGGVINAVTRSGSNVLRGSAFAFHRNSALDAKNYFDPKDKPIPDFRRNQFGATLGGPLLRDRTFFFGAYEGLIERLGITGLTNVPDADARRGLLPGGRQVTLHPAISRYIDTFFPEPNGRSVGGGIAEHLYTRTQPTNEHFGQGRIDHRLGESDQLFVRYTISNGKVDRHPTNKPPVAFIKESSRNQYVTAEHQRVFSPSVLNTVKFGINRSVSLADNVRVVEIPPDMSWLPGEPMGYFTISGVVVEALGDYRLPRNDRLNNFQWGDTLFITRGAHSMRVGGQTQYIQFNQETTSQRGGIVNFANLESFLTGTPFGADFAVPGLIDPIRNYRQWLFGFFIQDDIRLNSRVTVNAGLRYEFVTVPTEANGKISNLRTVTDTQMTIGDPWHDNPSLKNFAPRLGVAWDPFGDARTSVRGGFGIFHDEILPKYYFFSGSLNPPFTTRTSIANPPFPYIAAGFDPNAPIRAQLQTVNFDLRTPYMIQFNANVQRALPGDWDVMIGYVGSRGKNLIRLGDANLAPETSLNGEKVYQPQLGRRNPNFAGVWQRVTDAESFYNALQLSAVKRYSNSFRGQVSYTWAKSIDDSSGINSQDFGNNVQYVMDWYDRTRDRGLSAFHVEHNLTFNWTWDVPFGRSLTGLAGGLLKGWQINNVTTLMSGHPFTVRNGFNRSGNLNTTSFSLHDRPNVKPGCDPIRGGPDRYWDIACFELQAVNTRGNAGRNIVVGPGLVSVDLALVKAFELGGSRSVQVRAEVFNLPNRPNFSVPSGQIAFTNAASVVAANWGRITSTSTTARQVQLGLKYLF